MKFNKVLYKRATICFHAKKPQTNKKTKLSGGEKKNNTKNHNSEAVMTVQICDSRKKSYEATEN